MYALVVPVLCVAPTGQAGVDPLQEWALPTIYIVAAGIVARQVRGLHLSKVQDIKDLITTQWLSSSFLTVQLTRYGNYRLVDGMHRLTAVLMLIAAGVLPRNYTVPCVVYKAETPANLLLRHAAMVNQGNNMSALMTFVDKMRWIAVYMASLAPLYKIRSAGKVKKAKKGSGLPIAVASWFHVSAKFTAREMQGGAPKECEGYSKGTCQRAIGVLRALRTDLAPEVEGVPLLYQKSTAFTDLLVMDQLGQGGYAAWFATFGHCGNLAGETTCSVLPGTRTHGKNTTWQAPLIMNEANTYPKIFTHEARDAPVWPQEVRDLALDNAPHFLLARMYVGNLARLGVAATHDDGLRFLAMLMKRPRILVLWAQLREIAEPQGLIAVSAAGFGLMNEHHGKDIAEGKEECPCNCHWLHEHTDKADLFQHGHDDITDIIRSQTPSSGQACQCQADCLDVSTPATSMLACTLRLSLIHI